MVTEIHAEDSKTFKFKVADTREDKMRRSSSTLLLFFPNAIIGGRERARFVLC